MEDAADTIVRSLACVSVFIVAQDTGPEGAPGFASIQRSSVESLLDILPRYLRTLGTLSAQGAQHAGRAEANFLDVHLALKAVGVASPRELLAFSRVRELPYPHPVHILYPVRPSEMRTFASGCAPGARAGLHTTLSGFDLLQQEHRIPTARAQCAGNSAEAVAP